MTAFKLLSIAGLAVLPPAWLPAPESQTLAVNAVRFYRPDVHQTQVKVFIQIPYTFLEPVSGSSDSRMTYHVGVKVRDSTGLELVQNAWDGHPPQRRESQVPQLSRFWISPWRLAGIS